VDPWGRWARLLWGFLDRNDELAIALLLLVEEAGVPLPVPGDVALLIAGHRIAEGDMDLMRTLLLLVSATLLGSSALYWIGVRCGRPLLYRFGGHLGLRPDRLDRTGDWLRRRGWVAVVLGRLTPGLRIITPLAAGAFGVPFHVFLPALFVGSTLYIGALLALGGWLGPGALALLEGPELSLRIVLTVVGALGLAAALAWLYREGSRSGELPDRATPVEASPESAVLAGLLASVGMGLGVNLALYAAAGVGWDEPRQALLRGVDAVALRFFGAHELLAMVVIAVVVVLVNVVSALLYARVEGALPGPHWLRGLLFAVAPFVLWVVLLFPTLGGGVVGLGLEAGALPLLGEAARHALFGIGLGAALPLVAAARRPDQTPGIALAPSHAP
jgi:membrane protein DedA with SNARE-associated domain